MTQDIIPSEIPEKVLSTVRDDYGSAGKPETSAEMQLFRTIFRRWYIIVIVFLLIAGPGIPLAWYAIKPEFTTTGAIEVAPILTNVLTGEAESGEISNYEAFMNTQAKVMTSNRVLQRVADELKDKELSFFPENTDPFAGLKAMVVNRTIQVAPAYRTEWLLITMLSDQPREAEQVVNAFIREYMAIVGTSSNQEAGRRLSLLENERKIIAGQVDRLRQEKQELARQYGTVSLDSRQEMMMHTVSAIQSELVDLEFRRMNLQMQIQVLSQIQPLSEVSSDVISLRNEYINQDPYVGELTNSIVRARQNFLSAEQRYAQDNPQLERQRSLIESLQNNLDERRSELAKEFDENITRQQGQNHEYRLENDKKELEKVDLMIEKYQTRLSQEDQATIEMGQLHLRIQELEEQLTRKKEIYDQYGQRIQELELELKRPARISIADPASTGPPTSKKKKIVTAIVFGALAMGLFLSFLMGYLDRSLRTPDDIVRYVGMPIIGTTLSMDQYDRKQLPNHIANDYQAIRTNLGLLSNGVIPRILAVTSPAMGEGKTTLSINLAISLAKSGRRVLLVDGDLRKPDVALSLHLPNQFWGLQDVLLGMKEASECIQRLPGCDVDILACDHRNNASVIEHLAQPETVRQIKQIAENYDHVIIDTPPVLAAPDALLWAKMADAVVFSSLAGQTAGPDLKLALERLSWVGVKVLGNVLSNVHTRNSYHRYEYGYYSENHRHQDKRKPRPLLIATDSGTKSPEGQTGSSGNG